MPSPPPVCSTEPINGETFPADIEQVLVPTLRQRAMGQSRCAPAIALGLSPPIPLRFGGETGLASGLPIDAEVTVTGPGTRLLAEFGTDPSAARRLRRGARGRLEVVLITKRTQAPRLELFRNLGIEPTARRVVVVKSTNHFMAAFGPIAGQVIYIDADGPLKRDYRRIPYTRVNRPIWPLDEATSPGLIL